MYVRKCRCVGEDPTSAVSKRSYVPEPGIVGGQMVSRVAVDGVDEIAWRDGIHRNSMTEEKLESMVNSAVVGVKL